MKSIKRDAARAQFRQGATSLFAARQPASFRILQIARDPANFLIQTQ
jgi:hypothetical protein